jgi:NCAIR mutase (PurE)-related protein
MNNYTNDIIQKIKNGSISDEEAELLLKKAPFVDLDFAKVDTHRAMRQGAAEVIYGAGKTAEQIRRIAETLVGNGQRRVLITRLSSEKAAELADIEGFRYFEQASIGVIGEMPEPDGLGTVLVITAGTSDIPVAEEAAVTLEVFGNRVDRLYDCGVSGVHRVFGNLDRIMKASVIVCIAGMEGALPSVVGGLTDRPVIAVPTSVGYGASFEGLAALLSMMNSCASGVSVVNIDNGFGAGYDASLINHMKRKELE